MTKYIDKQLLGEVSLKAQTSPRKRMNYNFHQYQDPVQRMLNAIEPSSYIRPHRHINPPQDEIFLVLKGKGALFVFDDEGRVIERRSLDQQKGGWGVDVPAGCYHTIVSLESGSVFYEVKAGPFDPDADKGFAPWSPEEGSLEADAFLAELIRLGAE